MAKDTHSSEKAKKDEHNCSKGRTICTRSSASLGSATQETSGLRRSSRETPSKKPAPLASSTRKSERLEKQAPSPPSVTRRSERIEKKNTPSPLRRSDRGKSVSSLNSMGSSKSIRNSGSSSDTDQRKDKQEKSVEKLTNKVRQYKPVMTGRAYRALFIRQPKRSEYLADQHRNKVNATNQVDGNESDRNSAKDLAEPVAQVAHEDPLEQAVSPSIHSIQENGHVEEVSASSNALELGVADTSFVVHGDKDGAEQLGSERQQPDNREPRKLVVGLASARKDADPHLKRKRKTAEVVLDAPTMVANGDGCIMSSEGTIPSTSGCKNDDHPETCNTCQKRQKNTAEVVPDVLATVANGDGCMMSSEGTIPSASGCKNDDHPETCNTCQKRQKVNHDSASLANCSCITKPDQDSDCTAQGETEAGARMDFGETNEQTIQQDESHDCKTDSSSYPEYWVPVPISDIQLEQYCVTMLSNSLSLCSLLKNDPVRALHDTLVSARKTCDHPYIVDQSMQLLLTKDLKVGEILDVGIKASGKLQLLDAMLTEIRKKRLKAVVVFQTIGDSGRGLIGDILDDFMRQRFGEPSYERIDRDVAPPKKQYSMNRFNKESERFVLLLETRACSNVIKLSSVEAFILFDSSWNPLHDLRFIQKIKIESQSERAKIFRLYSPCTVEEKALLLVRQNKPVAENPSPLIIHALLMWGASYLFDKLDQFHSNQTLESGVLFEQSFIEDVIDEILSLLSPRGGDKKKGKRCLVLEAKHVQGSYSTDSALFGEEKVKLSDEDSPNIFWTKLLNGRSPRWKYCSVSTQRNRKRVCYLEDSEASAGVGNGAVAKKRKKVAGDSYDSPSHLEDKNACGKDQKGALESPSLSSVQLSPRCSSSTDDTLDGNDAPGLYSLCSNISEIPEDLLAGIDGRKGLCESQKSLHAALKPEMAKLCLVLQLSADVMNVVENFLEYVINNHHVCKEPTTTLQALQIAVCWVAATLLKQKINRKESLALAKDHLTYGCSRENVDYIYSMLYCLKSIFLKSQWGSKLDCLPKDTEQSIEGTSKNQVDKNISRAMLLQEKKITKKSCSKESQACLFEQRGTDYGSTRKDIDESIRDIVTKCSTQVRKLLAKHEEEKMELAMNYEKGKSDLEKSKKAKALVISIAWRDGSTQSKVDELKKVDYDFERKFDQLKSQMDESLKNLKEKHEAERKKLAENEADWIKRIKRWAEELLGFMDSKSEHCNAITKTSGNAPDVAGTCDEPADEAIGVSINRVVCEDSQVAMDPLPKAQNTVGTTMGDSTQLDVPEVARNGQAEDILPITSSQQHTHDVVTESRYSGPTSATEPEILAAADIHEKVVASNLCLSEDQVRDGVMSPAPDEDVTLRVPEIPRPLENGVSEDQPLNREEALVTGENNGASDLTADSATILDQQNEKTSSLNQESPGESVLPLERPVPAVGSGGSAVPDQAAQDMRPTSSSLAGNQHDPAPNTESQNVEEVAQTYIAELDTREVEAAETYIAEPNTESLNVEDVAETRIAELDTCEVEAAEPSVAEPDACEVEVAVLAGHDLPRDSEYLRRSSNGDVVSQNAETLSHHAEEDLVGPSAGVAGDLPATSRGGSMTNASADASLPNNHIPQSAVQAAPQMPFPLFSDPFQYELEKIHREVETATKIHEDAKSQLTAEFERKKAELQREYDIKFHEADAKLQARAKELEAYKNLVVMNKYLADAFKIKCTDSNAASRDTNSDTIQRIMELSTPSQAQRSSAAPSRPSVTSTAPLPSQLTVPPVPRPQSQSTVAPVPLPLVPRQQSQSTVPLVPRSSGPQQSQPTVPLVPRSSGPPQQSQSTVPLVTRLSGPRPQSQSTVPLVPHSSGPQRSSLFPMPQSRPPVIINTTPSSAAPSPGTTTPPVFSRVRAPAPHLQSYRSSSAPVSTTNQSSSLPRGIPAQDSLQNLCTSSTSPAVANHVPRMPSPTRHNSLQATRIPRRETGEGSNTTLNPPVLAAEETGATSAAAAYSSMLIQQQHEQQSNQDVVCLSDDE